MDLVLDPEASAGSRPHHIHPSPHNSDIPALMDIVLDAETLSLCNHTPLFHDFPSINTSHYANHSTHNNPSCPKSKIPALMDLVLDPLAFGLPYRVGSPSVPNHSYFHFPCLLP